MVGPYRYCFRISYRHKGKGFLDNGYREAAPVTFESPRQLSDETLVAIAKDLANGYRSPRISVNGKAIHIKPVVKRKKKVA
jgi:hypothetical protein